MNGYGKVAMLDFLSNRKDFQKRIYMLMKVVN